METLTLDEIDAVAGGDLLKSIATGAFAGALAGVMVTGTPMGAIAGGIAGGIGGAIYHYASESP